MALPARLFRDTPFFYACSDRGDVNHARAITIATDAAVAGCAMCVTWDIVSETATLLRCRRNFKAAPAFLTGVKPHLTTAQRFPERLDARPFQGRRADIKNADPRGFRRGLRV